MSGWRIFFAAAAIFNFVAGLPLVVAPAEMLASLGVSAPPDLLYCKLAGALVVTFGGLYALIAADPERYRPAVWLGVVGKAAAVALVGQSYAQGATPFSAFAVTFGDVAFIIGFLIFLLTPARRVA